MMTMFVISIIVMGTLGILELFFKIKRIKLEKKFLKSVENSSTNNDDISILAKRKLNFDTGYKPENVPRSPLMSKNLAKLAKGKQYKK